MESPGWRILLKDAKQGPGRIICCQFYHRHVEFSWAVAAQVIFYPCPADLRSLRNSRAFSKTHHHSPCSCGHEWLILWGAQYFLGLVICPSIGWVTAFYLTFKSQRVTSLVFILFPSPAASFFVPHHISNVSLTDCTTDMFLQGIGTISYTFFSSSPEPHSHVGISIHWVSTSVLFNHPNPALGNIVKQNKTNVGGNSLDCFSSLALVQNTIGKNI